MKIIQCLDSLENDCSFLSVPVPSEDETTSSPAPLTHLEPTQMRKYEILYRINVYHMQSSSHTNILSEDSDKGSCFHSHTKDEHIFRARSYASGLKRSTYNTVIEKSGT